MTGRMGFGGLAVSLVLTVPFVAHASSDEPAGINLGGTSFMDGFGRTDPGFVYQQYFQVEHYNAINDQNGQQVPMFQGTDINSVISLNQLIYVSPYHLLGGALGVDALLPVVDLNASFAPTSPAKLTADRGLAFGDLTWGAFLQMPPVMADGRPVFAQRFEFDVISPTGQYNHADDINPSSGFWSLNPFWAMTVLPTPNPEFSTRLHYLHNFQNNDPAGGAAPFRAGDAVWANFAASYKMLPTLNLGLNGYYFQQIRERHCERADEPEFGDNQLLPWDRRDVSARRKQQLFRQCLPASDRAQHDRAAFTSCFVGPMSSERTEAPLRASMPTGIFLLRANQVCADPAE